MELHFHPPLPRHLHELVREINKEYKYYSKVFLSNNTLSARKSQGETYSYWLASTDEEVEIRLHKLRGGRYAVLTGHWNNESFILGRSPCHPNKHFKVWRGVARGFGTEDSTDDLVLKERNGKAQQVDGDVEGAQTVPQPGTRSRSRLQSTQSGSPRVVGVSASNENGSDDKDQDPPSEEEPAHPVAATADGYKHHESVLRGNDDLIRQARSSPSYRPADPTVRIEHDDEIKMLDAAPNNIVRIHRAPITASSIVDDLQIVFKPADAQLPIQVCTWVMCNTVEDLYSHALAKDVISREDEAMVALLIEVVGGGDDPVKAFKIARKDWDGFENLHAALVQVVKDWGIKGTYVEVVRY